MARFDPSQHLDLPDLSDKGKDLPKDMWDPLPSDDDDSEEAKKKRAINIQPWMQQAKLRPDDSLWGYNWSGDYGNFFRHPYGPSAGSQAGAPAGSQYGWQSAEDAGDNPRVWADWELYDDQPPLPDEPDPWQPIPDLDKGWDSFLSNAQSAHDKVAREQTELWNVLQYGIDNPDITGGLTKEGKADYEFLKQYRVKEGGRPLVEGYGEEQWKGEALKGDWSDFYQPVKEPIGDTSGPGDHFLPSDPNSRYKNWDDWREQVPITEEYLARGRKPGDPDYTPPPSFPGQDIPTKLAQSGWSNEGDTWNWIDKTYGHDAGQWYKDNLDKPLDQNPFIDGYIPFTDKARKDSFGGEIAQIASSEGLQPGMIPSLQDNLARDTKQQRLAQETGTAIRQLETDQRSSEPTLAERLQNIPSLGSNIPGLPTGIGSNFIKTANDYLNIGSTAEKSRWGPIDMLKDEFKQRGLPGDGTKGGWDVTRGLRPGVPASQGGFGSGPTELARRALKTGGRLAKGAANLGVGIAADWATDKFLIPHVERAGQRMGKSLKNWANEFDARGSQYNPTLNRNVLRIPN